MAKSLSDLTEDWEFYKHHIEMNDSPTGVIVDRIMKDCIDAEVARCWNILMAGEMSPQEIEENLIELEEKINSYKSQAMMSILKRKSGNGRGQI